LGLASVVQAAPVDLRGVSADAKWLVHVDVDAVKASQFVERAGREVVNKWPRAKQAVTLVRDRIGMDPTKDLQGVTFYGDQIKKRTGVVLVHASLDQDRLLEKLEAAPDYRTSSYGSHTLHTWTHDKGTRREATVTGCFAGTSLLVLGPSAANVMAALDVLDGKLPNLAGGDSSLAAPVPKGTAVLIRAVDLDQTQLPVKSPLVKQSKALSLVVGENEGTVFAKGTLVAASSEIAERMTKVAEGLLAMATLQAADQPEAIDAINAIQISTQGATVTVAAEASADELWQCAEKIRRLIEAKRAGRQARRRP